MKPISELIKFPLEQRQEERQKESLDPLVCQLVDKIFVKMALLCRGFDTFYSDRNRLNAEKLQWVVAFTKHGIRNQRHVQPALNRLELHTYPNPPQLGEFLAWRECKPEDIGLPDAYTAFLISTRMNEVFSNFIHPDARIDTIISHVIRQIGSVTLRAMNEKPAFAMFENYYKIACRQFMEGSLEPINRMLPQKCEAHPIDKVKSDEARKRCMAELRGRGFGTQK